jgi:hypothetical protein
MRTIFVMMAALALAACTGHNFPKPAPESLILGSTTQDEVVAKYGPPYRQSTALAAGSTVANTNAPQTPFEYAMVPGTYASLTYYYADRSAQVMFGGSPTERSIVFNFWNGKLYAYNFISSFAADSTNFDENNAAKLEQGKTTKSEVIEILGRPTGEAVYPSVQQGERRFIYLYIATEGRRRIAKRLELLFDQNDKLRDLRFASDNAPAPAPAGGGSVPIFIPPPRGK